MERPFTPDGSADDARSAALDERPTPRRNRRRERFGPGEGPIPEYDPPGWPEPTAALPRDEDVEPPPRRGWRRAREDEDATSALPRERERDDATAALPSDGHW